MLCEAGLQKACAGAMGQSLNSGSDVSPEAAFRRTELLKMSPGASKRQERRLPERGGDQAKVWALPWPNGLRTGELCNP